MLGRKVGHRRVEDGHHKMGAHQAGRVACHASSLEWAVKLATCTFLSIKTSVFLGVFLYFKKRKCYLGKSRLLLVAFLQFTFNITVFFFCGKSHHTPFSTLPPPLKCVAMLSCVTYCILLQRSSAVYRWDTRRWKPGRPCSIQNRADCAELRLFFI